MFYINKNYVLRMLEWHTEAAIRCSVSKSIENQIWEQLWKASYKSHWKKPVNKFIFIHIAGLWTTP